MRRDLAVLIGTMALVATILGGASLLPAAERAMRHSDAKMAQPELPSPAALLLGYSTVFSAVLSGGYSDASELIQYLNSSYVPENIRYIFGRFNSLLASAVSDLNQTEILVGEARAAIGVGMVAEARALAGNASVSLWRANSTASLLRDSSATLASQLKVPQLRAGVSSVEARIAHLSQELSEVRSEIARVEAGELAGTEITIALDRVEAWVGSPVTASGFLSADGRSPVAGVVVKVAVEGAPAEYSAVTDVDGSYSVTFPAPSMYAESAAVYAYFPASGGYAGSRSSEASLRLLWLQPVLGATLNATSAKPGDWILVSGSTGLGDARGGTVRVSAFGRSFTVDPSGGAFSLAVQVPASAPSGRNAITVSVVPSGVVGPGSATAYLEVYRLPTAVTLSLPPASISGTNLTVNGRVVSPSDGEPVPNAAVSIRVPGGVYAGVSGEDGSFRVDVPVGLAVPTGWFEVIATAYPAAAAYQQSSASSGLYAVNPSIAAIPVAALAIAYSAAGRLRGAKGGTNKPQGLAGLGVGAGSDGKARAGAMSAVVSAYHRAAAAIGRLLGSAIGRGETLREFLRRVRVRAGKETADPFGELTRMAEEELYAGRVHEAARAESLLHRVISSLSALGGIITGAADHAGGEADGSAEGDAGGKGAGNRDGGA